MRKECKRNTAKYRQINITLNTRALHFSALKLQRSYVIHFCRILHMGTQSDSIQEVQVVAPPRGKRPKRFLEKNVTKSFFWFSGKNTAP